MYGEQSTKRAKQRKGLAARVAFVVSARKRLADMTPAERETHEAEKRARKEASERSRAEKRIRARATLDANVDPLAVAGDLPLAERETAVVQNEATMRGVLLADLARPNGGRALVMLREWRDELRILFTLAYVENGRAVRSRGWSLYLRDITADGEVLPSTRELDALIASLTHLRARLAANDTALLTQVAEMREAREEWQRAQHEKVNSDGALETGDRDGHDAAHDETAGRYGVTHSKGETSASPKLAAKGL